MQVDEPGATMPRRPTTRSGDLGITDGRWATAASSACCPWAVGAGPPRRGSTPPRRSRTRSRAAWNAFDKALRPWVARFQTSWPRSSATISCASTRSIGSTRTAARGAGAAHRRRRPHSVRHDLDRMPATPAPLPAWRRPGTAARAWRKRTTSAGSNYADIRIMCLAARSRGATWTNNSRLARKLIVDFTLHHHRLVRSRRAQRDFIGEAKTPAAACHLNVSQLPEKHR